MFQCQSVLYIYRSTDQINQNFISNNIDVCDKFLHKLIPGKNLFFFVMNLTAKIWSISKMKAYVTDFAKNEFKILDKMAHNFVKL